MTGKRWLTIPEAAALAGVPLSTMRRRLKYLHGERGGILRRFGHRRILVSAAGLQRAFEDDPDLREAEASGMAAKLDEHEKKILALRNAHRSLKGRVRELEAVSKAGHVRAISGHLAPNDAAP